MGVTAVCALAVATTTSAKNPKEVSLEISNNKLIMKTNPGDNDCDPGSSPEKGCIRFKKNEKSKIYFHLKGNTKCDLESGTVWKLNAVHLGGFDSSSKPPKDGYGFDSTSTADFNKVNSDFSIADRSSGLVVNVDKKDKKIAINNKNKNKYDVWYKIEAICERKDGKAPHITSFDPRVKNGGTN